MQASHLRATPDLDEPLMAAQKTPDGNDRIFTSNAQNDSGVLNYSFNDERYLPFEGAGVHSEWQLKLSITGDSALQQQFEQIRMEALSLSRDDRKLQDDVTAMREHRQLAARAVGFKGLVNHPL